MRLPRDQELKQHAADLYEHGVTCLRGIIEKNEVDSLRWETTRCIADQNQMMLDYGSSGKVINGFFLWTRNQVLWEFCSSTNLPVLAASLMGSQNVTLFCDNLFIKEPATPRHISPWHSDQQNWIVSGSQVITIWIALDRVTLKSGAVEFIRGSHRWNYSRPGFFDRGLGYEEISTVEGRRGSFDILHFDLEPGDATVHVGTTLHAANGNCTETVRRRAYAIRYVGDDARYRPNAGFQTPGHLDLKEGQPIACDLFPHVFPYQQGSRAKNGGQSCGMENPLRGKGNIR